MKTFAIVTNKRTKLSIVAITRRDIISKYVVAMNYDGTKEFGEQWDNGKYYQPEEFELAYSVYQRAITGLDFHRMEMICTNALHYITEDLFENGLYDFNENFGLEITERELEYFGFPYDYLD